MRVNNVMFNLDQKQTYIKYEENNQVSLNNYFKRLSLKERELNKDIADMNVDELRSTFISMHIRREETIGHMLSLIRGYISWAILNGKSKGGNAIDKITPESIMSQDITRLQMIKDPEHLESILSSTLDEINYENRTKRDSLVFWLIYSGIDIKELENLKKTDLDMNKGIVKIENGKTYEVYKQVINLWKHCIKITFLEKKNGKSKNAGEYIQYYLLDSDYLFRPVASHKYKSEGKCNLNTFSNITSKIINEYAGDDDRIKIPPANVRNSGVFYKLLSLEKQRAEISLKTLADYLEIDYDKNNEMTMRKWRIDYEDWKLAFGYMNNI